MIKLVNHPEMGLSKLLIHPVNRLLAASKKIDV